MQNFLVDFWQWLLWSPFSYWCLMSAPCSICKLFASSVFLPRVGICRARYMLSPFRPPVRRVDQSKQFSPLSIPISLVLRVKCHPEILTCPPEQRRNLRENRLFSISMCQYLENNRIYVQNYSWWIIGSCIIYFRLAPRLMSLDDAELLCVRIFWEFRVISQSWEATTAKRVNLNPYVRDVLCSLLNVLFSDV